MKRPFGRSCSLPSRLLQLLVIREESLTIEAAQLLERLVFDLADSLPADFELLANFRQGVLVAVSKPESQLQN